MADLQIKLHCPNPAGPCYSDRMKGILAIFLMGASGPGALAASPKGQGPKVR